MGARIVLVLLCLAIVGCGDNGNDTPRISQVFVDGAVVPGIVCPSGSTEAYRDGITLVCDACKDETACANGHACVVQCGPGCEDDTGDCCPVRVCSQL